jgi:hypothetical protein
VAYAEPADVLARWGKSSEAVDEDLTALINIRLGDVERMIDRRFKLRKTTLADEIAANNLDVEDVKQVESDAVLRLARNPDGYQSETDGTYNYMFRQDLATGTLEILPLEWATLGIAHSGMFTIAPLAVVSQ